MITEEQMVTEMQTLAAHAVHAVKRHNGGLHFVILLLNEEGELVTASNGSDDYRKMALLYAAAAPQTMTIHRASEGDA